MTTKFIPKTLRDLTSTKYYEWKKYVSKVMPNRLHLNMNTFPILALILLHHKMGTQLSQELFQIFTFKWPKCFCGVYEVMSYINIIKQVTNYSYGFYIFSEKYFPFYI